MIEGRTVLPAHDITAARGNLAADDRSFFVDVTDGSLDIRLVARDGDAPPIVNALRVTQRPDR